MSAAAQFTAADIAGQIEDAEAELRELIARPSKDQNEKMQQIDALHEQLRSLHGALAAMEGYEARTERPAISRADEIIVRVEAIGDQIDALNAAEYARGSTEPSGETVAEVMRLGRERTELEKTIRPTWDEDYLAAFKAWEHEHVNKLEPVPFANLSEGVERLLRERFNLTPDRRTRNVGPRGSVVEEYWADVRHREDGSEYEVPHVEDYSRIAAELGAQRAADRAAYVAAQHPAPTEAPVDELTALEARRPALAVVAAGDDDTAATARAELDQIDAQIAELRRVREIEELAQRERERIEREAAAVAKREAREQAAKDYETATAEFDAERQEWQTAALPAFREATRAVFNLKAKQMAAKGAMGENVSSMEFTFLYALIVGELQALGVNPRDLDMDGRILNSARKLYPSPVAHEVVQDDDPEAEPSPRAGCSICSREDVEAINDALHGGNSLRKVGEAFGIPHTTIGLHKKSCLGGAA